MDNIDSSVLDLSRYPEGTIYMMVGVSGSGKSTIASELSLRYNIPIVSPDEERSRLHRKGMEGADVDTQAWQNTYEQVTSIISDGHSTIIDATHNVQTHR